MLALVDPAPARRVAADPRRLESAGELVGIELAVKDTDELRGRVGLLRFRTAMPRRIGPSIPTGAMRPVSRASMPRETTSSCSSIPVTAPESPPADSRLPSVPLVRYAIRHQAPTSLHRSSRPVIANACRPRRHGYDTEKFAPHRACPRPCHPLALRPSIALLLLLLVGLTVLAPTAGAQGVTTSAINGFVRGQDGLPLEDAVVVAVHVPSGTQYRTVVRTGGTYSLPNMRVGGPYTITATMIGFKPQATEDVFLSLGQTRREDFELEPQAVELEELAVTAERDEVLDAERTGAATYITRSKSPCFPRSSGAPAT